MNINCAFGTFHPRTVSRLTAPLFEDLVTLCALPATGETPRAGRWLPVRGAGLGETAEGAVANQELKEHQMYMAFKRSAKKKYERQFANRDFVLSDVHRVETPKEQGKCAKCGYFACRCAPTACAPAAA